MADPSSDRGFERAFEQRLSRLFVDVPQRPDALLFAAQVRDRLERAWMWRRLMISFAGLAGGFLAVWQLAGSTVLARVGELSRLPMVGFWREAVSVASSIPGVATFPFPMELLWLLAGLLILAAGFLVTRAVDEL